MNQPRKPKKVKAPEGSTAKYITKGKEYDVLNVGISSDRNGYDMHLTDDKGRSMYCLQFGCSHLKGQNWIVTEWEDEEKQ